MKEDKEEKRKGGEEEGKEDRKRGRKRNIKVRRTTFLWERRT